MVKFYTCFPISMDGNQLSISMAPENMNLKDEVNNRLTVIFTRILLNFKLRYIIVGYVFQFSSLCDIFLSNTEKASSFFSMVSHLMFESYFQIEGIHSHMYVGMEIRVENYSLQRTLFLSHCHYVSELESQRLSLIFSSHFSQPVGHQLLSVLTSKYFCSLFPLHPIHHLLHLLNIPTKIVFLYIFYLQFCLPQTFSTES